MRTHIKRLLLIPLALLVIISAGFRECGGRDPDAPPLTAEEKAEAERQQREAVVTGVCIGIDTASQGLGLGIHRVKENRLAGQSKRTPAEHLALARKAKKFNSVMRKVAEYLLARSEMNDQDRRTLASDVDDMLKLAREIGSVTISTDAGKQFAFDLGLMAAKATLASSAGEFLRKVKTGDALIISAAAKSALQDALHYLDANDEELDASLKELGGVVAAPHKAGSAQHQVPARAVRAALHSVAPL